MTLSQLDELTDPELGICLYIVNIINPSKPPIEIPPRGLTWFPHDVLTKKILDAFPHILPEFHETYQSLLSKLGIKIEIQFQPPTSEPISTDFAAPINAQSPGSGSNVQSQPEQTFPSSSIENETTRSI